jgi:lipopolysaccharide biosynthesis glycosyltransferase
MNLPKDFPITIACAADDGYAMHMAVMLRSVLENIPASQRVCIFAIDGGIKESNKAKILASLGKESVDFNWITEPVELPDNLPLAKDVLSHANKAVYYRLLLADVLPIDQEKVIYLDSDLIVIQDLQKLWQTDIGDNYVLAVQDGSIPFVSSPYGLKKYQDLNISPENKYFNSGVLVINLKKWRDENISTKLFQYLETYKDFVQHHDQEAMNALFVGKWGEIEPQWNQTPNFFNYPSWQESPYEEVDYYNAVNNPYIVHFAGTAKPWNSFEKHPLRELFFHYLDMTAWSGWRFTVWKRFRSKFIRMIGTFNVWSFP